MNMPLTSTLRPLGGFERIIDLYISRNPVQFSLAVKLASPVSTEQRAPRRWCSRSLIRSATDAGPSSPFTIWSPCWQDERGARAPSRTRKRITCSSCLPPKRRRTACQPTRRRRDPLLSDPSMPHRPMIDVAELDEVTTGLLRAAARANNSTVQGVLCAAAALEMLEG